MKIISVIFILISLYIGISHGSRVFSKPTEADLEMMSSLGITNTVRAAIGIWSIVAALLLCFPKHFFLEIQFAPYKLF